MADNRIYLKCEECGGMLYLGKRLGGGYYWYNYGAENNRKFKDNPNYKLQDDRPLEARLNQFYDNHEWCGNSLDHYKIVYESDDDFEWKTEEAHACKQ